MSDSERTQRGGRAADPARTPAGAGADAGVAEALPFESALSQLEQTVSRLEDGDLPLEEALELFESGIELSRRCNATLDAAERRIEILMAERDGAAGESSWRPAPFPVDADLGPGEDEGSEPEGASLAEPGGDDEDEESGD